MLRRIWFITAGVVICIGAAAMTIYMQSTLPQAGQPTPQAPKTAALHTVTPSQHAPKHYADPKLLTIPKLGVNAPIIPVGQTAAGSMASPKGPEEAGWYSLGPRPGQIGSAVVAGHLNYVNAAAAIFSNLDTLSAGDAVSVTDAQGNVIRFTVYAVKTFAANEQPAEVFAASHTAKLNLITCTGEWEQASRAYTKRLVVFTKAAE